VIISPAVLNLADLWKPVDSHADAAIFTRNIGRQSARVARAWFLVSDYKKSSKAALKQGIATITDKDGTLIDLAMWLADKG
jgi:hypothetical protein